MFNKGDKVEFIKQPFGFPEQLLGKQFTVHDSDCVKLVGMDGWFLKENIKLVNSTKSESSSTQVGGGHYIKQAITPRQYVNANSIPFDEANAIKYLSRHRDKNGVEDALKALHYTALMLEDHYKVDISLINQFLQQQNKEQK